MTSNTLEQEYLSKDVFGMFAQNMRDRAVATESLNNTRFDKLETLIQSSKVEYKSLLSNLKSDIDRLKEDISEMKFDIKQNRQEIVNIRSSLGVMSGDLKVLSERQTHMEQTFTEELGHVVDTLSVAINGTEKRLEDFREELQVEQDKSLTKLGIRVALFVGAVQVAVSIALHFLG